MADGDVERLIVLMEARIRDFEKNMAKASGTATKSYGRMRKDSQTATGRMERDMVRSTGRINQALAATSTKIGGFGKAMIGGLVGGLAAGGVAGLVSSIGRVANGIAQVGDEARRAGVDFESFQELKYVAEQNRLGVDALTDGLKELNLRADEFIVTGGGSAAEAFQRLGYTAEDLSVKLQNPSALFTEIIGKLGELDKAAQIRIADEIFGGTGGERFVQLIEQGEQGIRDTIQEARNLGIVMDQDVLDRAEELDRKFNQVSNTVGTALKTAIVEAAAALSDFINSFNNFVTTAGGGTVGAGANQPFSEQLTPEQRNAMRLRLMLGNAPGQNLYEGFNFGGDGNIVVAPPPSPISPATTSGSGSRSSTTSDIEKQRQAVANLIAGLEFEKSLIGLTEVEQAKLNALREAGAAATDEQRQQIAGLVEQIHQEQAQVEYLTGVYDQLGQIGMSAVDGIANALRDGRIEAEELDAILQDVLGSLLKMGLNMIFNGLGAGFGSIFGFASGTANTGGQKGQVRGVVHGQEAVIPLPSGGKVPVHIAGGTSQAPVFNLEIVNETGNAIQKRNVRAERNDSGGLNIRAVIAGETMAAFADGSMDGVMGRLYGLKRKGSSI